MRIYLSRKGLPEGKKSPLLTLPLTCRLLAAVMKLQSLTLEGTMVIVQYHLWRNLIAYKYHRKRRVSESIELNARRSINERMI